MNDTQPAKAVKISRGAFSAAICYSRLVSVRGSIAVGIVDVAALSCMAALLKRWCGDMQLSAGEKPARNPKKRPPPPKKKKKVRMGEDRSVEFTSTTIDEERSTYATLARCRSPQRERNALESRPRKTTTPISSRNKRAKVKPLKSNPPTPPPPTSLSALTSFSPFLTSFPPLTTQTFRLTPLSKSLTSSPPLSRVLAASSLSAPAPRTTKPPSR